MLWLMLRREYISTPSRRRGVSGCLKDGRCLSCAPVQSGEGGSLWLHAEAIEGHRQHLVVANEHAELDDLTFVESGHELSPSGMGNNLACMQLIGGGEQQALPSGQIFLLGPVRNTGDGGGAKTRLAGEGRVLYPLVLRRAVAGRPQHNELHVSAGQLGPQQHGPGEGEPGPKEAPVAAQRGEDVRSFANSGVADDPRDDASQRTELSERRGRHPDFHVHACLGSRWSIARGEGLDVSLSSVMGNRWPQRGQVVVLSSDGRGVGSSALQLGHFISGHPSSRPVDGRDRFSAEAVASEAVREPLDRDRIDGFGAIERQAPRAEVEISELGVFDPGQA